MPDKWDKYAQPAQDKWEQYAQPEMEDDAPAALSGAVEGPQSGNLPSGAVPTGLQGKPTMGAALADKAYDLGAGVAKGPLGDVKNIGRLASPTFMSGINTEPSNMTQAVGKGAEQVGEYILPGGAEERLAVKGAEMLPGMAGLARVAVKAGTGGLINKIQGGNFSTGAVAGGAGEGLIQGARALAPKVAESALNIRKLDRAYKDQGSIGRSILSETAGVRPSTVAASAQSRLNDLTPQLESAVDRVSSKPNPIRAMLPPPPETIPLETGSYAGATPTAQGSPRDSFFQNRSPVKNGRLIDAKVNAEEPMEPRSGNPLAPISEYPGINPQYLSGGNHPEMSGRYGPSKGVLVRPYEAPIGSPPLSPTVPNRIASLNSARQVAGSATAKAARQGEVQATNQLSPISQSLLGNRVTGQPYPDLITPRELLDIKRGFGNEFIHHWNPETMEGVKGTAASAYHALDSELDRTVPESMELNRRISNLIPVAKRADSMQLNAPTAQKIAGRVAAHTGALTGAALGFREGREKGGLTGGLLGGAAGLVVPEMLASPTGQMIAARMLNGGVGSGIVNAGRGGLLQLDRQKRQPQKQP